MSEEYLGICHDCGTKHGTAPTYDQFWHMGVCEWCGKAKAVTNPRKYGRPKLPKGETK